MKCRFSLVAMITTWSLSIHAAPPNDNFADRIALLGTNLTASSYNTNATKQPQEPNHAGAAEGKSVWWTWTAPANGEVEITTDGSDFDTVLGVYTGTTLSSLATIANNDDRSSQLATSRVRFITSAGTNYQIAVDGNRDNAPNTGIIQLNLAFLNDFILRPSNDHFTNRIVLTGASQVVSNSNTHATRETGEPLHAGQAGDTSVWWQWTVPASGQIAISTVGSSFDTLLGIYLGNSVQTLSLVVSNDDVNISAGIRTSEVIFNATAGQVLRIAVDGFDAASGDIRLYVGPVIRPANDNFTNRIVLSGASPVATGSNVRATPEAAEPLHAGQPPLSSVWWSWTALASGQVTISTTNSSFDTILGVYLGNALASLSLVASNDDEKLPDIRTSLVTFNATAGQSYQMAVDGYEGAVGDIALHITTSNTVVVVRPLLGLPILLPDLTCEFNLTATVGQTNEIQASDNLTGWTVIGTLVNTNSTVNFRDFEATNYPSRFYRARVKP